MDAENRGCERGLLSEPSAPTHLTLENCRAVGHHPWRLLLCAPRVYTRETMPGATQGMFKAQFARVCSTTTPARNPRPRARCPGGPLTPRANGYKALGGSFIASACPCCCHA